MEDQSKMLGLMRFWLFGTFIIIWTAVTVFVGRWTGTAILREPNYWLMVIITAALCVGAYFVYKWWTGRSSG